MNWIKKRYDQFLLALLAIGLLACAVLIFLKVQSFGDNFSSAVAIVPPNNTVPPVPLEKIDAAKEKLTKPPIWTPTKEKTTGAPDRGSMFVSEHYFVPDGATVPEKPGHGSIYKDSLTGQEIQNTWFLENGLPLLEATVPKQDPDKDGFNNEDEWRGKTDPNNKDSHPPYYTKLFLAKFIKVAFRLVFKSYDGDPKKDPEGLKMSYGIDTVDLRQPSEFLKLGDVVPNTKFKLEKFQFKQAYNKKIEDTEDVSELTLANIDTGDKIVLIYNQVTDSPDVYALFIYEWPQPAQPIRVKKLQEFVLRPEVDEKHHYKLIDINDTEAQIQLPDGSNYTVKADPRLSAGK
jgi:hypothetical protein